MIERQIVLRFGHLDEGLRRRVGSITSLDELERLAEKVLTADSSEELDPGEG